MTIEDGQLERWARARGRALADHATDCGCRDALRIFSEACATDHLLAGLRQHAEPAFRGRLAERDSRDGRYSPATAPTPVR